MERILLKQEVKAHENVDLPELPEGQRWRTIQTLGYQYQISGVSEFIKEIKGCCILVHYDFLEYTLPKSSYYPQTGTPLTNESIVAFYEQIRDKGEGNKPPFVTPPLYKIAKPHKLTEEQAQVITTAESGLNKQWLKVATLAKLGMKERGVLIKSGVLKTKVKRADVIKYLMYRLYD
jgi:hypothetical protein